MTLARDRSTPIAYTLAAVLVLAAALRILWWIFYVDVIENEGVEYTRLAFNLFHGRGYVSVFGGTHTLFPPLYPILIGLAAPLAGSGEIAARAVSLLAGIATVAAVFLLALELFGRRVALLAGLTAACHPLLVAFSVTTFSEPLYGALCTLAVLAGVRCVREPKPAVAASAGALVGLAYLTRPEGIALAVALAAIVLAASLVGRGRRSAAALLPAVLVLVGASAVALPYVVHLSRIAGGFRWEGKGAINTLQTARLDQGMSLREASYGLGPNAEPAGPFIFADQYALLARPSDESGGLIGTLARAPFERLGTLSKRIAQARFLGAPPIFALALAGLVLTSWWRSRLLAGAVTFAPLAVTLVVLLTLRFAWDRYFVPLLPVVIVWAAAGTDWAGRATFRMLGRLGWGERSRRSAEVLVCALLTGAVLILAARGVPRVVTVAETRRPGAREAGTRLAEDYRAGGGGGAPMIASVGLALAHYAEGEVVYLPHADESRTLRYLRDRDPDYVALRRSESDMAPYAAQWLAGGLPDECARELDDLPGAAAANYRIWRWDCGTRAPGD